MVSKEEASRIMKESDLTFNAAAVKEPTEPKTTEPGFLEKFGGVIVGGVISGGIFFGLGRFLDWFSKPTEEDEQTEDQV